jgi:hypothetical protein
MEQKRSNFVRLAEGRVNRALRDIRLIGNLSNRSAYSFTEDDVKKVFKALQRELDAARARFGDSEGGGSDNFKL